MTGISRWAVGLMWVGVVACSDGARPADPGRAADPFADRVVSFSPGAFGGYGAARLPGVVLGPPHGGGDQAGSLDVVSLGRDGTLVVAFDDIALVDGPGPDLLVFENPFSSWFETAEVAVSRDGVTWLAWPCAADDNLHGWPGCAGVRPVYSAPGNGIAAVDPVAAGGDAFDLADLPGAATAVGSGPWRFVRITDSGRNPYAGNSGGFDLDAVAVVNGAPLD